MKLNDAARELIGEGTDATLVTINPDGSPQATVVWVALESTPDGDELVAAHLAEYQKTRNVRRDPRVAVTILSTKHPAAADAVPGDHRHRPHRRGRRARTAQEAGQDDARLRRALPAAERAAGTADPHPDRQGRRHRSLGVLTPEAAVTRFSLCHHASACVAGSCSWSPCMARRSRASTAAPALGGHLADRASSARRCASSSRAWSPT